MTKDDFPVIFHDDFIYSEENVSLGLLFVRILDLFLLDLGLMDLGGCQLWFRVLLMRVE